MEKQAVSRLKREYGLLLKSHQPNFIARPSETDILTWHYVIFDLPHESPYAGGQYHGKLIFPREYPLKPPSILMCTLSGRFEVNKRLCLSMSDYHPETWNPSWRVETILIGLVSFMLDETDPATTGGISTSFSHRRADAAISFFRNARNVDFKTHFPELIDPDRYFVGYGFSFRGPPRESQKSLTDFNFSKDDIESVMSIDNLQSLVSLKGPPCHPNKPNSAVDRPLWNFLPWALVASLVIVWLTVER